ncbi:25634_t:CDS:1, partial [Gigaspora margarita]
YILPVRKPITAPTTIPRLKKSIYKRNLYGRVWGLAREATLLAVEQEDNEIVTYLQGYISRKRNGSVVDEISNNAWESQTNKSSDQSEESEESEADQDKDMIETNLKN